MTTVPGYADTPPLRYVGSKWILADWIISKFPPHQTYVEPFCGGASVFFRKRRSPVETINDIDGEIINFFDVLRNQPDRLIGAISLTPYSRHEYERALRPYTGTDPVERARRYYVAAWQSFGSTQVYRSGWRRQVKAESRTFVVDQWRRLDGLLAAADRLRQAQIENRPALEIIADFDGPDTLFYVDPPYPLASRAAGQRRRYRHEMTDADHVALLDLLLQARASVLLSSYLNPLYDARLSQWTRLEKSTTTNGNGTATEFLYINPRASSLSVLPLFEHLQKGGTP